MSVRHADATQLFKNNIPGRSAGYRGCHRSGDELVISKQGSQGRLIINAIGEAQDSGICPTKGFISSERRPYQRISRQKWQYQKGFG